MKTQSLFIMLLLFFSFFLFSPPAGATVVCEMDFDQLLQSADIVFSGKVIAKQSRYDFIPAKGKSDICTFVTVSVEETLKGEIGGDTYTLKLPGGELPQEQTGYKMVGIPEFNVGEEVILFIKDNGRLYSPVVGFYQGRFNLVIDKTTGYRVVYDFMGRPVPENFILPQSENKSKSAVSYEFFKQQVKTRVKVLNTNTGNSK